MSSEYIDAYLDYYPLVYSMVYYKTNNREEAEDLCQEIFIIFYEKFDTISKKRSWLLGTARMVLMNFYRKKKPAGYNDMDDQGEEPAFLNGSRDTRIIIKDAINNIKCDDVERMLIDMIAVHNFNFSMTAKIVGMTRRKVHYRYGIIVKKLIAYMKKIGIRGFEDLL